MKKIRNFDDVSRLHVGDIIETNNGRWEVVGKDEEKSYPDLPPPVFTFSNVDTDEKITTGWWQLGPEQGFCNDSWEIVPALVGARLVAPVAA